MKRKSIIITCGIFVFIAIIAMLVFVFNGKTGTEQNSFNITGTWEVAAVVENNTPHLVDGEFMTFNESIASDFRDGNAKPYITSKYEVRVEDKLKLVLSDISREYIIDSKTDNHIRLYEGPNKFLVLLRQSDDSIILKSNKSSI